MRIAFAVCLAACGDNADECGRVVMLSAERNIWPAQLAVDDEFVYYSDYDNGAGLHLVFRNPRDGGKERVFTSRARASSFGYDMAVDSTHLYWSAELDPVGYTLLATPVAGGSTIDVGAISSCTAHGIAVDANAAYAGAGRCGDIPARVTAFPHDGSAPRELWSSIDADVGDVETHAGDVLIATSAGLQRVSSTETTLLDGRWTYHVEVDGDEIVYSTEEAILALPFVGGAPRTLYTFRTPVGTPRPFAADAGDLYIAEPPELVFLPRGGEPRSIVRDIGALVTHVVARDGVAYWSTHALPGSLGIPGSFSGGVLRIARPCE